jgi:hypothetical protein
MELSGQVIKREFGKGSKSEHDAIVLDTGKEQYVLRRRGGNPFSDPELEKLVGKKIRCHGELVGYTFFLTQWEEV